MNFTKLYTEIKRELADGRTDDAMQRLRAALPTIEQQRPDYYHPAILLLNDYQEIGRRAIQGLDVRPGDEQQLAARLLDLSRDLSRSPLPGANPPRANPLDPVLDGTLPQPEIRREGQPAPPPRAAPKANWTALGIIVFLLVGLAVANVVYQRYQRGQRDVDPSYPPAREAPTTEAPNPGDPNGAEVGQVGELYLKRRLGNLQLHDEAGRKLLIAASGDRGRTPNYKFTLEEFDGPAATATGTFYDSNTRPLGRLLLRLDDDGRGVMIVRTPDSGGRVKERFE